MLRTPRRRKCVEDEDETQPQHLCSLLNSNHQLFVSNLAFNFSGQSPFFCCPLSVIVFVSFFPQQMTALQNIAVPSTSRFSMQAELIA